MSLALYIHWPFCLSLCPYCDFNAHTRDKINNNRWKRALLTDISYWSTKTKGREITSIYFGGGTPSLMNAETVFVLLQTIMKLWKTSPYLEISMEANPTSIEMEKFQLLRDAGINRVSIGIQALRDNALEFLGRKHDQKQGLEAISLAAKVFPTFSFDLIYSRPEQTIKDWSLELTEALKIGSKHVSLYQLTIEKGTPFYSSFKKGSFQIPNEKKAAKQFEITQEICEAHNVPAYEISNHAKTGAICVHNLNYWNGGDYIGVGPGAHGRLTTEEGSIIATEQIPLPENWINEVEKNGHAIRKYKRLNPQIRREELIMLGLRLSDGIKRDLFYSVAGVKLEEFIDPHRLNHLKKGGFLILDKNGLRTTPQGRLRLNAVLAALLA